MDRWVLPGSSPPFCSATRFGDGATGVIPDLAEAAGPPLHVATDRARSELLLRLVPQVPAFTSMTSTPARAPRRAIRSPARFRKPRLAAYLTLDPGGFGGVTITKSITLRSDSIEAGVLVSGTSGIIINAGPSDKVVIDGLDFEGTSNAASIHGINILQARDVLVRNSIPRFLSPNSAGIVVNGSTQISLTVENCTFFNNTMGIAVTSASGLGAARVFNSTIVTSTVAGIRVNGGRQQGGDLGQRDYSHAEVAGHSVGRGRQLLRGQRPDGRRRADHHSEGLITTRTECRTHEGRPCSRRDALF